MAATITPLDLQLVDYEGREVPSRTRVSWDSDPALTVEVAWRDGRFGLSSVALTRTTDGPEIDAEALRRVADRLDAYRDAAITGGASMFMPAAGRTEAVREYRKRLDTKRRRRYLTDELLAEVAAVYTANPDAPTKAVAEHFRVSSANASRYVRTARDRGLLAPWKDGK